jgi:hypothetical protein
MKQWYWSLFDVLELVLVVRAADPDLDGDALLRHAVPLRLVPWRRSQLDSAYSKVSSLRSIPSNFTSSFTGRAPALHFSFLGKALSACFQS